MVFAGFHRFSFLVVKPATGGLIHTIFHPSGYGGRKEFLTTEYGKIHRQEIGLFFPVSVYFYSVVKSFACDRTDFPLKYLNNQRLFIPAGPGWKAGDFSHERGIYRQRERIFLSGFPARGLPPLINRG